MEREERSFRSLPVRVQRRLKLFVLMHGRRVIRKGWCGMYDYALTADGKRADPRDPGCVKFCVVAALEVGLPQLPPFVRQPVFAAAEDALFETSQAVAWINTDGDLHASAPHVRYWDERKWRTHTHAIGLYDETIHRLLGE